MPGEPNSTNHRTLASWKEIAQFFGRDVRTVQRWEKEEGLPVHRHLHRRQSSVYAEPAELEAWWSDRGSQIPEPAPEKEPKFLRPRILLASIAAVGMVAIVMTLLFWRKPGASHQEPSNPAAFRTMTIDGTHPGGQIGEVLTGDVNGDGKQDLIASAGQAREVHIVFGKSLEYVRGEFPAASDVLIAMPSRFALVAGQVGDFNGDGIDDLLLTEGLKMEEAYYATPSNYLVWGRREWAARLQLPEAADVKLRFDWVTDAKTAGCLRSNHAADLNADAMDDVLLGSFEYGDSGGRDERNAHGLVSVLYGRKNWPKELEVKASADVTIRGSQTGEGLGETCKVGDFNGDGLVDLAVRGSEYTLWARLGGRGKDYVFLGRPKWPARMDAKTDFDLRVDSVRPLSDRALELADVNGDGRDDLVVGIVTSGATDPGVVQLWFGSTDRKGVFSGEAADVVISGGTPAAKLGATLSAADFDGDGFADLLVTEPGAGKVYLLYGRREWNKSGQLQDYAPVTLFDGEDGAEGWRITQGDLDGDGLREVVFAAAAGGGGHASAGRAWVVKPYLPVQVDLRPGEAQNVILYPRGLCAVRVYGFSGNERDQIEPASIRLAGATPEGHVVQDYNGDGIPDVQAHFVTGKLRVRPEMQSIQLTARTRGGLLAGGSDSVVVIPSEVRATSSSGSAKRPAAR